MNRHHRLLMSSRIGLASVGFLFSGAVLWASSVAAPGTSTTPSFDVSVPTPSMATTVPVEPEYQSYVYYGDRYRDPFIPLNSDVRSDSSLDRAPSVASLDLKGIIQDSRGRMALITGGVNSYILRDGRLYDGRNRMVKGISGVIKTDSVVIIGSDRTVKELRAKPAS